MSAPYSAAECVEMRRQERAKNQFFCCQIFFNLIALAIIIFLIMVIYKERRVEDRQGGHMMSSKMKECEMMFDCLEEFDPVCGTDGLSYDSKCELQVTACAFPEMSLKQTTPDKCSPLNSVALIGGNQPMEGNVYARNPKTGMFGPVCDDAWSIYGANVVCTQMGYAGAMKFSMGSYFGSVTPIFSYDNVKCKGFENMIDDCRHTDFSDCNAFEAAGVVCYGQNQQQGGPYTNRPTWAYNTPPPWSYNFTSSSTIPVPVFPTYNTTPGTNHTVVLYGGPSPWIGNVYALNPFRGFFGPVCDDYWDLVAADVVCKFLGYPSARNFTLNSAFGQVSSMFSYDDVKCDGNETSIDDCIHNDFDDCGQNEGAGVICNYDCFDYEVDYAWTTVESLVATSAFQCQEACGNNVACYFFTFQPTTNVCNLKDYNTGPKYQLIETISGPKVCY